MELKKTIILFFPKKLVEANNPAIGKPKSVDINKAMIETFSERKIISYKFLSNDKINFIDSVKASTINGHIINV
jgi:hypothetical protein